jgi:hypothetical protein
MDRISRKSKCSRCFRALGEVPVDLAQAKPAGCLSLVRLERLLPEQV